MLKWFSAAKSPVKIGPKKAVFRKFKGLKCVVTEVVLFSVVAIKTLTFIKVVYLHIWGAVGSLSDSTITNFNLILKVKKVWKLVNILRSYEAYNFLDHRVSGTAKSIKRVK